MSLQDPTPHPTSRPPITPVLPSRSGHRYPSRAIRLFSKLPRPTPVCHVASPGILGPLPFPSSWFALCWSPPLPVSPLVPPLFLPPLPNSNLPIAPPLWSPGPSCSFPVPIRLPPVILASLYSPNPHQTPTRQSTWWTFNGVARSTPELPFYPTPPSPGRVEDRAAGGDAAESDVWGWSCDGRAEAE
jgi:hypothetical protein